MAQSVVSIFVVTIVTSGGCEIVYIYLALCVRYNNTLLHQSLIVIGTRNDHKETRFEKLQAFSKEFYSSFAFLSHFIHPKLMVVCILCQLFLLFQYVFESVRGSGFYSDIAIDDVELLAGPCPTTGRFMKSFFMEPCPDR